MQSFKNRKIVAKFILWFLLISLLPLTAAIYVSYTISRKALTDEIKNSLSVITDNKANQIEAYAAKLKKDFSTLSYTPEFIDTAEKFVSIFRTGGIELAQYRALELECKPIFLYYQQLFGYDDILLVNLDGETVFSLQGNVKNKSLYEEALSEHRSELSDVFIRAKTSQEIEVSSFEYYPQSKDAAVFIALPVFKGSDFIGIAVFQVNSQRLHPFVQDYTGLGQTGEVIIVSRIGDEAVYITPVRFDPEAAFKRKIPLGSLEGPGIQKALQGEKGSGRSLDYRNQKVLEVWRYLPTFRVGMVVKMDNAEIIASANKLRNTLLNISFLILMSVVAAAVLIARSISRPIRALTQTAKTISQGNLSARVAIEAQDEIGELAQSFNLMTDSLVEAKANVEQEKAVIEEQRSLLEAANKELDSFVYTVSHDLRAPLRGIDGLGALLEQEYAAVIDGQGKEYLHKMCASAKRMQQLIDDLLTLSRISRIKYPYEDVLIEEMIKSIIARLDFDIKKYNVEMVISNGLPLVRCDKIKIEEALFNLISNAIKFSSKNKEARPRVEIGYNGKDEKHEFYVKDNGIGIDKKNHEEIFGIFKRLHKESEYEGTGAGLSIVKKIIQDHDGSIWVESDLGKGAAFHFTIPKTLAEWKRLGQILVEEKLVSEKDVEKALKKQGKA